MTIKRTYLILAAAGLVMLTRPSSGGPAFRPEVTFKGSTLAGWHILGQADWKAQDGELTGTVKPGGGGGWLVLDRPYQDIGFHASFRCTGGCKTGVLLRAEKTPQGMKGIYISLTDGAVASYKVTLDPEGKELSREVLRRVSGQLRIAPPPDPTAAPPAAPGGRGAPPAVALPLTPPPGGVRADEWNELEFVIDANIVRAWINNTGEATHGVADPDAGGYGPIALYIGGAGEVRFKDIGYRDATVRVRAPEKLSSNFRMQRLSDFYYGWGATAADFNHDGQTDISAGPHIYFGPDFTKSREFYLQTTTDPSTTFAQDCWMEFAADFTGDGWTDIITASFGTNPGVWLFVNPKGEQRLWDKFHVVPTQQSEIAVVRDVDGDGKMDFVYMAEGFVRYATTDPANPTGPWIVHTISERGLGTAHGIGVGDINGDGRKDILNPFGWFEQPPSGSKQALWTYHPQAFGRYGRGNFGGSVMAAYDINGDGLNDVVTSLTAHGFGLAWFEQKRDAGGTISFVQHMIMDDFTTKNAGDVTFTEPHATTDADVDGDGITDFVVAKRYWSHSDAWLDPDPYGDPVLYYYRTVRNPKAPGGAEFVPELIHNRSGGGSDVLAVDINKDKAMDIVTATRFGTFVFWGKPRSAAAKPAPPKG